MEELEIHAEPAEPEQDRPQPRTEDSAAVSMDELLASDQPSLGGRPEAAPIEDAQLKAVLEAIIYVAEEPATAAQIAGALGQPPDRIQPLLDQLVAEFDRSEHGLLVKEVAGGYKMAT